MPSLPPASSQDDRYRRLVETVADYAIFMLDPNGIVLSWNRGAQLIKGYAPAEIIGQSFRRFYAPEDLIVETPSRLLATAIAEGHAEEEGWRLRKDGSRFWADVVITAMRGDDGQLLGFSKVTRDLTERKQAEHQRRQFELLVRSVTDYAILTLDPAGHITTWNRGAQQLKGYTEHEILGEPYERFFTPEDVAAGKPAQILHRARELGHIEDEGWRLRKDGSRFWALAVVTALYDDGGQFVGFGKVTRDLTERRLAQEGLEEANRGLIAQADALRAQARHLEETDRYKDEFLSVISHELRTPLNFITGFASLLEDEVPGPLNPRQLATVGKILTGADRMLGLVENLLELARIQSGKLTVLPEPVEVVALAADALGHLGPLADQAGLTLALEAPAAIPASLDPGRLAQVFTNLVGNAIKFTPTGGTITVTLAAREDRLAAEISDTGTGISPEDLPRLFQRFSQLDMSNTRAAGGTGLGLAISKALIEAHGGEIGVRSDGRGRGATFWFTIPLVP